MEGKLILIEGTDCSGKETQTKRLVERLRDDGFKVFTMSFPDYDSPTGKIIGGPYLGKPSIGECVFPEGTVNVNPRVASHYYAADRLAKKEVIEQHLAAGEIVILDRYMESNMAHQGSKIEERVERFKYYKWCIEMEYKNNEIPKPDITLFLHMPYEAACMLRGNRGELDGHENSVEHLMKSEATYVELARLYKWTTIPCVIGDYRGIESIKMIDQISEEVYQTVRERVNGKGMVK